MRYTSFVRPLAERLLPIEWGKISPLRLKARILAEGIYSGSHRSTRRGAGVEFGGHREYVPGDDLRFLDRRSLLRHDKLMIREFETDTERALWLCLDASASMAFRGEGAPGAKLAYASLLAAALTRIAIAAQDPVGLVWFGGANARDLPPSAGAPAFERVVNSCETVSASGAMRTDRAALEQATRLLGRRARRGSIIILFSDLLDLADQSEIIVAALAARGRALVVVQVLDEVERELRFDGKVRLMALEGKAMVETDADAVRAQYKKRLAAHLGKWRAAVEREGGRLISCVSADDAVGVMRRIVEAVMEARR